MRTIKPTQTFILVQFIPKDGTVLLMPDGQRNPEGDIVVLDVGPDVPKEQGIEKGVTVLLRGDAKTFGIEKETTRAIIDYRTVIATVTDDGVDRSMLDEALAAVNSN